MLAFVFSVPDWVTAVICLAALITASTVVWKLISKFSRMIYLIETNAPILLTIAEQFKKNGGKSLKDQIDRIEKASDDAVVIASDARTEAIAARATTLDLVTRLDENVKLVRSLIVVRPTAAVPHATSLA